MQKITYLLTCIIGCMLLPYLSKGQDNESTESRSAVYSRVKVKMSPAQFQAMINSGVEFDHISHESATVFMGEFSSSDLKKIVKAGGKVQYIVKDVMQDYLEKNEADKKKASKSRVAAFPAGFAYGTMGSFLTYSQIVAKLDWMRQTYPNLITVKQSIGTSVQGNSIWMVKISDNASVDENEPKVLYNALHHAREPMSMTQLIYFMCYALEKYGTDPEITNMINNRELYFIPCVNPDGYLYNQSTNPSGGGMWRKNRKKNSSSSYGVDLNRNYGYKWGYDNVGSSGTTTAETYRGISAFSEPETKAMRDFSILKGFKLVMSYHAYGNYLINPFNYAANVVNPDSMLFRLRGGELNEGNVLKIGTANQTVNYSANGDSSDWGYGDQTSKPKFFAWSPEIGVSTDGFWPVQSRIEPLCIQMLRMNINFALMAGEYYKAKVPTNQNATTTAFNLSMNITNYGFSAATTEYITFTTTNANVISSDTVRFNGLAVSGTVAKTLPITLSSSAGTGTVTGNLVIKYIGGYTATQAVAFNHNIAAAPGTLRINIGQESLEEVAENAVSAYPNPTTDIMFVKINDFKGPIAAQIINSNGQVFSDFSINNKQTEVGVSTLKQGSYFMKIETDKGYKVLRFTKQ